VRFPDDEYLDWRRPAGIFVLAPIAGAAAAVVRQLQERSDAKLAAAYPPHVTLAGSSGVGPIRPGTTAEELRRRLEPVAAGTVPMSLTFGPPQQFMGSDIVSLPLDPHGPLRELHDRVARCGLPFGPARFTFSPHVTLNLYRSLSREAARALLTVRVSEPALLDRLVLAETDDPHPPRILLELPFALPAPAEPQ
jgi:2'-5' RNA ligase